MDWLNYHHLLFFYTAAKEGGVVRASEKLRLSQPAISGQIRLLEEALGEKLFEKAGRGLVLTGTGKLVFHYAEEIFSLGKELSDVLAGRPASGPPRLAVGISDAVPKLIAYRVLRPALEENGGARLVCHEDRPDRLLAALVAHEIDMVLSDAPAPASSHVRAHSHFLGSSPVSFFAPAALAARLRPGFPASLNGAPLLLPGQNAVLRRALEAWFASVEVRPRIVAECDDSALLKVLSQSGAGAFAAPAVIEKELKRHYGVVPVGPAGEVSERFYAISFERRLKHPVVLAILDRARGELFA